MIKEAIIVIGQENGIRIRDMAEMLGLDPSAVSKRREAARAKADATADLIASSNFVIGAEAGSLKMSIFHARPRLIHVSAEFFL